jgi:hypothetical protein
MDYCGPGQKDFFPGVDGLLMVTHATVWGIFAWLSGKQGPYVWQL